MAIVGASSGIGREVALLARANKYQAVLFARRGELLADLDGVRVAGDVCVPADVERLVSATSSIEGVTEIALVNCAGIVAFGEYAQMPWDEVQRQIETNLLGMMRVCHAFLPAMLEAGNGQIVNVLSVAATHVFAGAAAYGASKAGGLLFTKALAAEVRAKGIRVCALSPGSTDTPIWAKGGWSPPVEDMLSARAVAETIMDVIESPRDRSFDEILLMPPKGIL